MSPTVPARPKRRDSSLGALGNPSEKRLKAKSCSANPQSHNAAQCHVCVGACKQSNDKQTSARKDTHRVGQRWLPLRNRQTEAQLETPVEHRST